MSSSRRVAVGLALVVAVLSVTAIATAARPGFVFPAGCCFYEGDTVRTVVPPSAFPNRGTDPFYAVMSGASGQKAIDTPEAAGHVTVTRVAANDFLCPIQR